MNAMRVAAIALIAAGVLALVYGKFSYTKERHDANIGSLNFSLKEKETVNVPAWAGVVSIAAGTGMLVIGRKK
ncbi:MAG TPA: hypothetical protein VE404_08520 [Verrucomicrobiae bacterium]|nr:hypothetical protein [Verrucomicrobiae bacterium]